MISPTSSDSVGREPFGAISLRDATTRCCRLACRAAAIVFPDSSCCVASVALCPLALAAAFSASEALITSSVLPPILVRNTSAKRFASVPFFAANISLPALHALGIADNAFPAIPPPISISAPVSNLPPARLTFSFKVLGADRPVICRKDSAASAPVA